MSSEVVQADGEDDEFRGLADVHLLCFNQYPTATSSQLGNMIDINTSDEEDNETVTEEDYSLCQEVSIPIGTSHFAFYARAADTPQTHEERMRYGTTEAVGLDRSTYSGNGGIRFRPVQICTSADALGGSSAGHALLTLLNNLMNPQRRDSIVNSPFLHRITLTTKDGHVTQLTTFEKLVTNTSIHEIEGLLDENGNPLDPIDHDRIYGLFNEGKDFILLQYYIFDKVLHPVEYYEAGHPIINDIEFYEVFD